MIIGFDAKRLFNNATGLGNYSRTLVNKLSKEYSNDQFVLFTPKFGDGIDVKPFQKSSIKIVTPQTTPTFMGAWWRMMRLGLLAKKHKVQLYHGLSQELPRGLRLNRIKSVVTIHDLIFLRIPESYAPIDRQIYLRKMKHACRVADAVVAISQKTADDLHELLKVPKQKLTVIYQGCDPKFEKEISTADIEAVKTKLGVTKPFIICVGTIEKRKDQLTLVKAFLEGECYKTHELILIGRQKKHAKLIEQYLAKSNHNNSVKVIPSISGELIPAAMKAADVLVYPSRYEGFGLPVLEALTVGVPVIAANGSCLEETGGDAALYFKAGDSSDLTVKLKNLLSDAAIRQSMVEKGHAYRKKFSDTYMAEAYHALYRRLLQ